MQTFLPYPSYRKSAEVLDNRRLGKQRVETKQILLALTKPNYGWQNHPIVKMWKGREISLCHYGIAICNEWRKRGYKDTLLDYFKEWIDKNYTNRINEYPRWLGDIELHASHRSNLLRKDKNYYSQFNWTESDNLNYKWII